MQVPEGERPFLLHLVHGVVGRLKRRYAAGEYVPWTPDRSNVEDAEVDDGCVGPQPLTEPVVELESGHAFLDREGAFRRLTDAEVVIYLALEDALKNTVMGAAVALAQGGVLPGQALQLVVAAMTAQLRALRAGVGPEPGAFG